MRVKLIDDMSGNEGKRIRIEINGKETTRRVKYNEHDGLYIIVDKTKLFEYEFKYSDVWIF